MTRTSRGEMEDAYENSEIIRILQECVQRGTIDHLRDDVTHKGRGGMIDWHNLKECLVMIGQCPETDAVRFCNYFDKDNNKKSSESVMQSQA